jgi:hypothetical protein
MTWHIIMTVGTPYRMIMNVGYRPPGMPPYRTAMPSPWGHPTCVIGTIHVLNRRPGPDIHNGPCGCCSGVGADLAGGFNDCFNAIDILIADDLQNSLTVSEFFQFDHGNILHLPVRDHSLKNESMDVSLVAVMHPDVINVSVAIQVEIVNLRVR